MSFYITKPELPASSIPAVSTTSVVKGTSDEAVKQSLCKRWVKKIVEELRTEYKKDTEILTH